MLGKLAVPSFVVPGTVAANVRFLRGKVGEVGLCFFETQACLAYTETDLLPTDGVAGLRFHVHLPLDLPWPRERVGSLEDATQTANLAVSVLGKASMLGPRCAVLHAPVGSVQWQRSCLSLFARKWYDLVPVPLLLENTPDCAVAQLGDNFLENTGMGFCLDTGHLLGYEQNVILDSLLPEKAALVHWSAPGATRPLRHLPLTDLDEGQMDCLATLAKRLPDSCPHMLEIFSWDGILASLPVLRQFLDEHAI